MSSEERSAILTTTPAGVVEGEVTNQNLYGAIRTLWEQGVAKKEIGRRLGTDVKTVRKWLKQVWVPQTRRRQRRLDRWRAFLHGRAAEVGFNAVVLTRELTTMGYEGSYAAVVKYVAPWRAQWSEDDGPTVRFETGPGQQAQVDWGQTRVYLGEEQVRVHLFTMVLGYSRRLFAKAYRSEGLDPLLDGHACAFAHFGGRTEEILYDNPRTIVHDKDEATGQVDWNPTFKDRMDFYGVKVRLCRYYRAQTKGKIESGVKYVKRNALAGKRFRNLEELNAYLLDWCLNVADQRVHGTTHEKPVDRFARAERLTPVDLRPVPPREQVVVRRVPRDAYVAVETNRYPVPFEWVGRDVTVQVLSGEVVIRRDGERPIDYARMEGRFQLARWVGSPRSIGKDSRRVASDPPRFDPFFAGGQGDVEVRPLSRYEEVTP
jgi:transposase